MENIERAEAIRGKTVRLTWTDGPTRGMTHEHVFHQDGTVEWHDAGSAGKGGAAKERPPYAAVQVADGVYVVSDLAASGYTLTVVLNLRDKKVVGFASSSKDWHPIRGKLEVVS